jgi:hypothetical protein
VTYHPFTFGPADGVRWAASLQPSEPTAVRMLAQVCRALADRATLIICLIPPDWRHGPAPMEPTAGVSQRLGAWDRARQSCAGQAGPTYRLRVSRPRSKLDRPVYIYITHTPFSSSTRQRGVGHLLERRPPAMALHLLEPAAVGSGPGRSQGT